MKALLPNTLSAVMNVLFALSQGHTLTASCDKYNITVTEFQRGLRDAELEEQYLECEQRGLDRLADILLTIDTDPVYGQTDPRKMKIASDNIKWYLAKKRPQQFGERVIVENTITADRAIIEALEAGRQRAITARNVTDKIVGDIIDDFTYTAVVAPLVQPPQDEQAELNRLLGL